MEIRLLLITALLGLSLEAQALQLVEVTDGQTVTIKVSTRDLTRIAMADGGRIVRVWGMEDHLQVEPDKESGQLFLRPVPGMAGQAISFFLRDDQGATHTLLAVPVDMPSDTVLLRTSSRVRESHAVSDARPSPYIESIQHLIRAMARGAVPEGYIPATETREVPLWSEAKVVEILRYTGDFTGEIYRLTNVSTQEMRLDEREVAALATDIKAVAIQDHVLAPAQSTRLYLVREGR